MVSKVFSQQSCILKEMVSYVGSVIVFGVKNILLLFVPQEYEELANKIHELQTQLQEKEQALPDYELEPPEPPPKPEPPRHVYPTTPITLAPSSIGNGAKIECGGDVGALPSPSLAMKSPVGHVKAFLPNNQRTSVSLLSFIVIFDEKPSDNTVD